MSGTTRAGMLLLLAACGGGAAKSDSTAMSSTSAAGQSTSAAPDTSMGRATRPDTTRPSAGAAESAAAKPQDTAKTAAKATTKPAAKAPAKAQDTSKAAAPKPKAAAGGQPFTPQQVALGDSIFHGLVGGGTCAACHGADGKGTAVAPDLTDQQWLNGDGSYDFMVRIVTEGVPKPKQHPAPMPPKGGAPLTDEQVKAVAAYEYSLSHKT
jgi:mono/diheme cytochrome c family protein